MKMKIIFKRLGQLILVVVVLTAIAYPFRRDPIAMLPGKMLSGDDLVGLQSNDVVTQPSGAAGKSMEGDGTYVASMGANCQLTIEIERASRVPSGELDTAGLGEGSGGGGGDGGCGIR